MTRPTLNLTFAAKFVADAVKYSTDYDSTFDADEILEKAFFKEDIIGDAEVSAIYIDLVKPIAAAAHLEREVKLERIKSRGMDDAIGDKLSDCEAHRARLEQIRGIVYNFAFRYGKKDHKTYPYLYNIAIWQPTDPREGAFAGKINYKVI